MNQAVKAATSLAAAKNVRVATSRAAARAVDVTSRSENRNN